MPVTVYRSSDASAPTLSGSVGDLVTVLDAVLVNGYGAKAAAGWTKPYTGTNGAVFRSGTGSNQFFLNVNDNGPGAGTAKEARVVGYETMSAFATGVNPFPTVAQFTNGLFLRKSVTADATQRAWIITADARTMNMFILTGDTVGMYYPFIFGDFYSLKASDGYRTCIIARATENTGAVTASSIEGFDSINYNFGLNPGHYIARDVQGNVGAIQAGKAGDASLTNGSNPNAQIGIAAFTNPADLKLYLAPLRLVHTVGGNTIRGRLRGLWHFCHAVASVSDGDTFTGSGDLAGRTFLILKNGTNGGVYTLETSNTWDAN